jgi:hypothetical protein
MASSTFHADMLLSGVHISKEQGSMSSISTDSQAHFAKFLSFSDTFNLFKVASFTVLVSLPRLIKGGKHFPEILK